MPVTKYRTVNGRILSQNKAGAVTEFLLDPLGSVIGTSTSAGVVSNRTVYWPFGEVRTGGVSSVTSFGFCGGWGYYTDSSGSLYVRARYYRPVQGRWQTVDPIWPYEMAYGYVNGEPVHLIDWDGSTPQPPWPDTPPPGECNCKNRGTRVSKNYQQAGPETREQVGTVSVTISVSGTITIDGKIIKKGYTGGISGTFSCTDWLIRLPVRKRFTEWHCQCLGCEYFTCPGCDDPQCNPSSTPPSPKCNWRQGKDLKCKGIQQRKALHCPGLPVPITYGDIFHPYPDQPRECR